MPAPQVKRAPHPHDRSPESYMGLRQQTDKKQRSSELSGSQWVTARSSGPSSEPFQRSTRSEPPQSQLFRHMLGPAYLLDKKAPAGRTAWRRLNAIRQA